MPQYGPFPGVEVQFDRDGKPVTDANGALTLAAAAQPVIDGIAASGATDLIVISHGWNNDKQQARDLYTNFFTTLNALVTANSVTIPPARKFFVMAVLWPSARFVDPSQIPGGAAGVTDTALDDLRAQLAVLRAAFEGDAAAQAAIDQALAVAADLDTDQNAQVTFVRALNALPSHDPEENDTITTVSDTVAKATAPDADVDEVQLLKRAAAIPVGTTPPADDDLGGAASIEDSGGAAGNIFGSIKAGALSLASLFTYKTMKERAGTIGRVGLAPVLGAVRASNPTSRCTSRGTASARGS